MTYLQLGQVIRLADALYRVDFVNDCRARITPLMKRHVVLADGTEFDAQLRKLDISPNSVVQIVSDVERAKNEIALEAAEKELARVRAEVAREARTPLPAPPPPPAAGSSGWHRGAGIPA